MSSVLPAGFLLGTVVQRCESLFLKIVMRAAVAAPMMAVVVQWRVDAAVQRQQLGSDLR
jgi:hypothetical protein